LYFLKGSKHSNYKDTYWTKKKSGLDSRKEQGIFLSSTTSRPAL